LKRLAELRRRVKDLSLLFSKSISSSLNLAAALEALSRAGNDLLGTRRTSVWVYDRRAWQLALTASSDPAYAATAARVAGDDPHAPAARGLRLESPEILTEHRVPLLIAPLRGWRRALGTLVVEGAPPDLDQHQFLELAQEFGRQVSVGIENVQLLEEIQRQRRLLEDTFNSLADLVVVADKTGRVVQVNDAFVERMGGPAPSLLDRSLVELVGPEIAEWAATPDAAPRRPGATGIATSKRFDDERLGGTFAATVTPLINQEGQPVGRVLVMRDITVQVRLEAEQEALRARLGQSEKLASLGQFVAGIAHEMNNPLQGVLGHLELLIEMSDEARPLRRDLKRIYQEADRAAKIVRNLLMFTGSRRVARRRVRIHRVLARALASRRAALQRAHISVVCRHAKDVPSIVADPLLLQQAFLNILINAEHAITASGKRGRIEIRTKPCSSGSRISVTIRDTGGGIPADVLPRIFDPFFTTKEVGQGTGLGLAITYGIVNEHGGTVQAANAPNGGAIFTVELPAAADA
jgi:PAS domain S-box-containing protein